MSLSAPALVAGLQYSELRRHELRKSRILMIDGSLVQNSRSTDAGTSARVYGGGYWGFASVPGHGSGAEEQVSRQAAANACAMSRFGPRTSVAMTSAASLAVYPISGPSPGSARKAALIRSASAR